MMKQLTIEHNHGVVILQDAEIVEVDGRKCARGVCVGGGNESRLFTARSYQPFPTGVEMTYPAHRIPYCVSKEKDHWWTSVTTCG